MAKAIESDDTDIIEEKEEFIEEAEAPKVEAPIKPAEEIAQEAPKSLIYYGPTLKGGILSQFTVFKGGIPKHITDAHPEIVKCFADVSESAKVMKNISDPHSIENANISAFLSTLKKGK